MDGKTRVCGIIANPVEHSMSPLLQNLYAERTGINVSYVPFKVETEHLAEAVTGAYHLNIQGLNVTVPHKQEVMKYLKEIDRAAAEIGAVNTLVRIPGGYKGYNTDVPGLLRAVREQNITIKGRRCILLGAGGAARAAAYLMVREGAEVLYILNRSREKAKQLAAFVNRLSGREMAVPLTLSEYEEIPGTGYFAVQSTSVGMYPHTEEAPIEEPDFYEKIEEAMDCVYTPAETKFMRLVKNAGGQAFNGLSMLLYQGVISYELWNPGVQVEESVIEEARELIRCILMRAGGRRQDLILIGFMGAGKTTVGKAYAQKKGFPFRDTDEMIEREAGVPISTIFEEKGEGAFRKMETELLEQLLLRKERGESDRPTVYSVGGGLPMRRENRELLNRLGRVIYLEASSATVLERLKDDTTRPLLQGEHAKERVESLLAVRQPIYEEAAHHTISVNGKDISQILTEIEAAFGWI